MKKLLLFALLSVVPSMAISNDTYFKAGPLELTVPLKTTRATYMFDFNKNQNLVGAETPIASIWQKVEGTVGVVTSLSGQGAPFVGGNILLGNIADRWVTLPADFAIGGFGAYDFREDAPLYGIKASVKLWGN